jgi:hypothetical protein
MQKEFQIIWIVVFITVILYFFVKIIYFKVQLNRTNNNGSISFWLCAAPKFSIFNKPDFFSEKP